jgi:lipopolysaccharide export system protein LptC
MLRKLVAPLFLCLGVVLVVAAGYWNINPDTFSNAQRASMVENPIDFYAVNTHSVQYLADGRLQSDMTSERLEHVQATDVTVLTEPRMELYRGTWS